MYYTGEPTVDTGNVTLNTSNFTSATDPVTPTPTPSPVSSSTFDVAWEGQPTTYPYNYEQGYVHLVVTQANGQQFSNNFITNFSAIEWSLSDNAADFWTSNSAADHHYVIYASLEPSHTAVDLYFPPERNESPVNGSTAGTMTLQIAVPNDANVYATSFTGGTVSLADLTEPLDSSSPPTDPTTGAQLQTDLNSTSPEYDVINLPAGQTVVSYLPITITHSVEINGNGATLEFDQTGSPWPSSASGAITVPSNTYANIQVTLNNFTIEFADAPQWSNPSGDTPTLYDPENLPSGVNHAVIDDEDSNINYATDIFTITKMSIYGPPAYDASPSEYSYIQAEVAAAAPLDTYVGELDMPLIRANPQDSGTIGNCTFQGGPIEVNGGPWTITNNTFLGATAYTISQAAVSISWSHDLLLEGNTVIQQSSTGYESRLDNMADAGYDNVVEDNSFGGNAGLLEDVISWFNGSTYTTNWPEVMLQESTYNVVFEGRPGAISSDGRILVLPNVRSSVSNWGNSLDPTGAGLVVSIVSVVNGGSSAGLAGEWFPVAQQVSFVGNALELLMQTPLPQMPAGGYYVVEVNFGCFVNNAYIGNTINITGKSSLGLSADANNFGMRVIGNHFVGGSVWDGNATGTSITLEAGTASAASGTGAYPLPPDWTVMPNLGSVIEGNVIQDSLGGIDILIGTNPQSTTGRVYITETIVGNTFEWDSSFLQTWFAQYSITGNGVDDAGNNPNDPTPNKYPPTIVVGAGFQAEGNWGVQGFRFPMSVGDYDFLNNADIINFVDPSEISLTIQANTAETINSDGTLTPRAGNTGQIYAGTVNGTIYDPVLDPGTFNTEPYYVFNLLNLNTVNAYGGSQGIQALAMGQDSYDLVGSGSASPDGIQDLHVELAGLSASDPISIITITDNSGDKWVYGQSGSPLPIDVVMGAGSTTADIFIQPPGSHLDDTFAIQLTYATGGGPITIPLTGVLFNPLLQVLPSVPQSPLGLSVTSVTTSQVSLSWNSVPGATSYLLQRTLASSPTAWSSGVNVPGTSYTDTSVTSGTAYLYQVSAVNAAGGESSFSLTAAATTTSAPSDSLTASAWSTGKTEGALFNGTVATFVDTNHSTLASGFTATINWGDSTTSTGTVTGSNGAFTVSGSHTYSAYGNYAILVKIAMVLPGTATASTVSTILVNIPFTEVSLSSYFTQIGITADGSSTSGGLDSAHDSFSNTALGGTGLVTWNTATFQLGAAGTNDAVAATGQTITLPSGSYTGIELLGTATGGVNQAGVFTVNYSGSAYDKDTLGFSDWNQGYNGATTNAPGESTVVTMSYLNTYTGGAESKTYKGTYLYGYVIPVNSAKTLTSLVLPNDSNIKILAIDLISQPPQVNLSSYFNTIGLTTSGSSVAGQLGGSKSYSSTAIGSSTVTWSGNTFNLGPANANDVMASVDQTVWLPAGSYASIAILGASANGYNQDLQFWVDYADGSQTTVTMAFSDWSRGYNGAATNAPGEATALTTSFNQYSGGTEGLGSGSVYLYGYVIPVNPNKIVTQIQIGNNSAVDILAMDLIAHPQQVNLGYGNSSGVALPYNEIGLSSTNSWNQGGIDSAGDTYSEAAAPTGIGESVVWNGQTFAFGPGGTNNVVQASGQSITLAPGNYTSLQLLGASSSGYEETGVFTVYYVGGSYDTFTQAFSDWKAGYLGTSNETTAPGESIVESPTTYNKLASGPTTGTVYLYGYVFPLNAGKTVSYIKLPNDTSIKILAMDEVYQPPQVNLAAGSTSAAVPAAFNQVGIGTTLTYSQGNLDGHNDSYSSAAQPAGLGSSVTWNGQTFSIGPADAGDVVQADGQAIELPQGNFTSLMILGAFGLRPARDQPLSRVLHRQQLRHDHAGLQRLAKGLYRYAGLAGSGRVGCPEHELVSQLHGHRRDFRGSLRLRLSSQLQQDRLVYSASG